MVEYAGYCNGSNRNNAGNNANLWSRELNSDNINNAWYLNLNSDGNRNVNNNNRYNGYSVRGVLLALTCSKQYDIT